MRGNANAGGRNRAKLLRITVSLILAVVMSIASARYVFITDERAMYGLEGTVEQNWQPREVAGWPAPFLADDPNTSVPHKIGLEDNFRPGPFVATLSFWFLLVFAAVLARSRRRAPS